MKIVATIVAALMLALAAAPAAAQSAGQGAEPVVVRKKPRTRVTVRPLYPYRSYHTLYPTPYNVEYPGPNAHRECASRLVTEHRPSGTVIVPRMRCWWAKGRYAGP